MRKFQKGDWVRIAKNLGPAMQHFTSDTEAVVQYSYTDKFGGDELDDNYSLYVKGEGSVSWYYGHQLTLIESGRLDKIKEWKAEAKSNDGKSRTSAVK